MTDLLTAEEFLPHVEKLFRVRDGRHALRLMRVEQPPPSVARNAPRPPFNLIFSGPPGDVLREGTYTLDVENGPTFSLYVIPIQTFERDRQDYQSTFN